MKVKNHTYHNNKEVYTSCEIQYFLFFVFYFLLSTFNPLLSQDIHFSQYDYSPLNLNPGLIGGFNGEFRFVGNQRTQWNSVTAPYSTYGFSVDAKHVFKSPVNAGLAVYQDKAGDSDFSTFNVGLGGAYGIQLDSLQTLTLGLQPTFTQRSINYSKLQFDNQYNGSQYDGSLSNGENFGNEGYSYFNLHTGLSWQYNIAQRKSVTAGFAVFNLFKPKQTFFNDQSIKLQNRFVFHTNGLFAISDKIDILPSFLFQKQAKFKEIIFGGEGKYHLNNGNYKAVYAGIFYRNSDASYVTVGLDYADFRFGVSYDFNVSSLNVASNYRGGFEFSIIYILSRYKPEIKRYKACPDYI